MKKLSKKEREEVVTKGYFHDTLEEVLDERFGKFRKEFRREINEDFKKHIDVLMEHHRSQLEVILEGLDNRYVLRSEWTSN